MDAGMFVIHAHGEKFIIDLGSNNYNVSDLTNTYRFRAEGHNTVIFDPDEHYAMKKFGNAKIVDFKTSDTFSCAVGDMTDAYDTDKGIEHFRRGIRLDKATGSVTVKDEIKTKKPVELYWFAHTRADITISDDGKTAVLTQNKKTLYAHLISEAGRFTVMDAIPLPTSPQIPDQDSTEGIRKLTIHIPKFQGEELCVVFRTDSSLPNVYPPEISKWV